MGIGPHVHTAELKPKAGIDMEFLTMGEGPQRGFVISPAPGSGCWWVRGDGRYYKIAYRVIGTSKGKKVWMEVDK